MYCVTLLPPLVSREMFTSTSNRLSTATSTLSMMGTGGERNIDAYNVCSSCLCQVTQHSTCSPDTCHHLPSLTRVRCAERGSPRWSPPVHILRLHSHRVGCAVLEEGQIERQCLSRCHGSDRPIGQCDIVCEVRSVISAVQ